MIAKKRIDDRIAQRVAERERAAQKQAQSAELRAVTLELAAEDRTREARAERERCEAVTARCAARVTELNEQIALAQAEGRRGAAYELEIERNLGYAAFMDAREAERYASLAAFNVANDLGPAVAWEDPNAGPRI